MVLNVKNSSRNAITRENLQNLVKNHIEKNLKLKKNPVSVTKTTKLEKNLSNVKNQEAPYLITKENLQNINLQVKESQELSSTTKLDENLLNNYQQFLLKTTTNKIESSTKWMAQMDSFFMEEDQSVLIDFDALLNDFSNDVSNEENFLINQLMMGLKTDNESNLIHQQSLTSHESDLDLPDLSELPLEDFADIEAFLDGEAMLDKIGITFEETSNVDIDDILESISVQSSPSNFGQNDQDNMLLDSMFDSDFMQEFATISNTPADVFNISDTSCLSETTEIMDSSIFSTDNYDGNVVIQKAGAKRTSCETLESETTVKQTKCEDEDEDTIYVRKPNESEREMVRRVKNNAASRITRSKRREKHGGLFKKETELEKSNAELRIKIELMEKEAEMLRQILVAKLSGTNN